MRSRFSLDRYRAKEEQPWEILGKILEPIAVALFGIIRRIPGLVGVYFLIGLVRLIGIVFSDHAPGIKPMPLFDWWWIWLFKP